MNEHESQNELRKRDAGGWQHLPALLIAALGLLSAGLYWGALVRPYALLTYVDQPLRDLGKIGGYDPAAGWRFTLPLLALWLAYGLAVLLAPHVRPGRSLGLLAGGGALAFTAILLWLYPITAADIFNYALYGLVQHAGGNPLITPPNQLLGPPLIGYSAWPAYPSPYGPLWQGLAWLVTALSGDRLLPGILLFKGLLGACHLLNTLLIARLAATGGMTRPDIAALLYGWNPFLLYETIGNGHNDIVMLTALLLALGVVNTPRRDVLALPLVALAALTKWVGALWFPPLALGWLPGAWRARRWSAIGAALLGTTLLIIACFAPFWAGDATLDGVRRQSDLYTTSFGGLLMIEATQRALPIAPQSLLDLIKETALGISALTILIARPRNSGARAAAQAAFDVTLAYLLVGALWFQPWYLVPLVGLAPLVGPIRRALATIYALGATGSYIVYFYLWPALAWTPDRLLIQRWATFVAHGPVLVALVVLSLLACARATRRAVRAARTRPERRPAPGESPIA